MSLIGQLNALGQIKKLPKKNRFFDISDEISIFFQMRPESNQKDFSMKKRKFTTKKRNYFYKNGAKHSPLSFDLARPSADSGGPRAGA